MDRFRRSRRRAAAPALISMAATLCGCAGAPATPVPVSGTTATYKILRGATGAMGIGRATAFVRTDAAGHPEAMGLTFGDAALRGLPTTTIATVLPLPAVAGLPFREVVVNWQPHGHPPAGIYTVPHFDIHFYEIPERLRRRISRAAPDASVTPAPSLLPAGYKLDPDGVVPAMGIHALPLYRPEFHGQPFTASPIWGYWDGKDDFIEGMVTLRYLQSRQRVNQPIRQPAAVTNPGEYPSRWHVVYDRNDHRFVVTMDEFVHHG